VYFDKFTYLNELTWSRCVFTVPPTAARKNNQYVLFQQMTYRTMTSGIELPRVYQVDYGTAETLSLYGHRATTYPRTPHDAVPFMGCHPLGTSEDVSTLLRKYNSGKRSKWTLYTAAACL